MKKRPTLGGPTAARQVLVDPILEKHRPLVNGPGDPRKHGLPWTLFLTFLVTTAVFVGWLVLGIFVEYGARAAGVLFG